MEYYIITVMLISFIVFALYQFREDTDAREITMFRN